MVAELFAGDLFHLSNVLVDLTLDLFIDLASIFIILCTCLCCNGEALRNRQTNVGHLSQIRALTTKQFAHVCITFGKQIYPFLHTSLSPFL